MSRFRLTKTTDDLSPDEVFADSGNLPSFDTQQFEGVMTQPIRRRVMFFFGAVFLLLEILFLFKIFSLQVVEGKRYRELSERNSLNHTVLFSERGVIYDRNGEILAWNEPDRTYRASAGLSHILGYVSYPTKREIEEEGFYSKELIGREGAENIFNETLHGKPGIQIIEVDVSGATTSESILAYPKDGENITLSIDSRLTEKLYGYIADVAYDRGFRGGGGVIMDVKTGEILALASFPEYSSSVLSSGSDREIIGQYTRDVRTPFLNRVTSGLYTPGSIFKPFVAIGALAEKIITPETVIHTEGELRIPNPYNPEAPTIFRDWKNHGDVAMEQAIAYSSNVYFFELGGGFGSQPGLGIKNIERYARMFGFGVFPGSEFSGEKEGLIPTPDWKESVFGDEWRIGDTYNTAIGQYSSQVTPLQMVRAVSALANSGNLLRPTILERHGEEEVSQKISLPETYFETVRNGMRSAVKYGTASGLNISGLSIAAKTGTAEIDFGKQYVNSWVVGFFPADAPRYAFTVVMERGPRANYIGGVFVMRQLFEWMLINTPEYLKSAD